MAVNIWNMCIPIVDFVAWDTLDVFFYSGLKWLDALIVLVMLYYYKLQCDGSSYEMMSSFLVC